MYVPTSFFLRQSTVRTIVPTSFFLRQSTVRTMFHEDQKL